MPQNFYELLWIFIIYAFAGWCTEVGYAALNTGKFVNRGFLNGPYCPIYGCGIVIVVGVLTPLKENLIILFIGSFLLTSLLEFITGFLLEKVFHNKWWDYSELPFNIKGYVCLKFSIYWGLACTFIMSILHPIIYKFITVIPHILGIVLISVFMGVFAADVVITVSTILKFNKRLKAMDDIARRIHAISDEIGEKVYENVTSVDSKQKEYKLALEENLMELSSEVSYRKDQLNEERERKQKEREELLARYKELMEQKNAGFRRLLKAFPNMISHNQNDILKKYREHLASLKNK